MKHSVNLFSLMPPKQQRSFKHWYLFSVFLFIAVIACIAALSGYQLVHIFAANKKRNILINKQRTTENNLQIKENLQSEKNKLEKYQNKVQFFESALQKPIGLLSNFSSIIPKDLALTQFLYQAPRSLQLSGAARNLAALETFIAALKNDSRYKIIKIDSLQRTDSLINFKLIVSLS